MQRIVKFKFSEKACKLWKANPTCFDITEKKSRLVRRLATDGVGVAAISILDKEHLLGS